MKKFYFLMAVLFTLVTAVDAQLAMQQVTRKVKQQQARPVSTRQMIQSLKRTAPGSNRTATTYWSDDFSDSTRWVKTAVIGTDNWVIDQTGTGPTGAFAIAPIASATAANGFALFDSDLLCSGDQTANLETAGYIDLSTATTARLVFSQFYRHYFDSTFLFVSGDSGTTWTKFNVNPITVNNNYNSNNDPSGTVNPDIVSVNISSVAAGHAGVKLRFQFYSPSALGAGAGCAYAWMIDDILIEDVPANDISVIKVANPSEYSSVPILQVQPFVIGGYIANLGGAVANNASITVNIYDGAFTNVYNSVTNAAATLNPGDTSALLTAPLPYTPSDTGAYYFEYICSMTAPDGNTSNDTTYEVRYVDDAIYARDYTFLDVNYYSGGLGFNANTGYLGQIFDVYIGSQFTSVDFWLANATLGDSMSVDVFDVVGGTPGNVIGTTGNYVITANDTGGAFINLPLVSPVNVSPGQYFVAAQQKSTNNLTIGSASEIFTPNRGFYQVAGGAWTPVENAFERSFLLRVNNPSSTQVSVPTVDAMSDVTVFPNPTKGILYLNGKVNNAVVTITNALGQAVYTNTFNSLENVRVDLSQQPAGLYTVRVQSENGVVTRNVMVSSR
ncbi:MAG: hypothetical protein RL213_1524 [Bacteroidota bacterium]|jgi:hypothetical protein